MCLLAQVRYLAVAGQAGIHWVGLDESRVVASMRIVAVCAISRRTGMLHFGFLNLLGFVGVAGYAQLFRFLGVKNDLAVFCRRMAGVTGFFCEGRMHELRHQFGRRGLMWIVASQAVRRSEGLIAMRLPEPRILEIMAIRAKCGNGLGQVEVIFCRQVGAGLVNGVAGIATQVERGMATARLWYVESNRMAIQAEVLTFIPGCRLEQLILVVACMWIVALEAVANRRGMNRALDLRRVFFRVAGQAELVRRRRDQFHAGYVFVDSDFVAAQASDGDRGVDRLAFTLVVVAFQTLGGIDVLIERNRMRIA